MGDTKCVLEKGTFNRLKCNYSMGITMMQESVRLQFVNYGNKYCRYM